jgi:hypothetical protein
MGSLGNGHWPPLWTGWPGNAQPGWFAKTPNGPQVTDGFSCLDMRGLSKAVDSTAWLIKESLRTPGKGEVLIYLGDNDVRYLVLSWLARKLVTRYVLFARMLLLYYADRAAFLAINKKLH